MPSYVDPAYTQANADINAQEPAGPRAGGFILPEFCKYGHRFPPRDGLKERHCPECDRTRHRRRYRTKRAIKQLLSR